MSEQQLFVVRRANYSPGQPCDHATFERVPQWDRRTMRTIEEYDEKFAHHHDAWRDVGEAHDSSWINPETGEECIKRRIWQREWVIRCSFGDLLNLARSYGEVGIEMDTGYEVPVLVIGRSDS